MNQQKIKVRLLGREYQFGCSEDERASLLSAADYLDKSMQDIKARNSTMTADKVVLMAAMNISHEFIKSQNQNSYYSTEILGSVKKLNDKLEEALSSDL